MSYSTLRIAYPYPSGSPHHDPEENAAIEKHKEKFGEHNDVPPGWREIPEEEFVRSYFFRYSPEKVEHRQLVNANIKCEKGRPLVDARLYFFHDGTGVAMMQDFWAGKLRYFAFGCAHKYQEVHGETARNLGFRFTGNCQHAHICEKCGHRYMVDSSD
jgi:hypothetical protein